ncbi:MAG: hypothetical protein K2L82_08020 [Lachnospiraceae bacterium]|nr:hypothetical protein [Lachnospiraceae bacterium]
MRKEWIAALMGLCVLLSACGQNDSEIPDSSLYVIYSGDYDEDAAGNSIVTVL